MSGRVALVTGGASGIGAAIVAALRRDGLRVVSLDLRPCTEAHLSVEADVGDAAAVEDACRRASSVLAPPTLAVHAAGITRDAVLWKLAPDDWSEVLRVNLTGAWNVLRAVAPSARAAHGGAFVLVGSINGARGKIGQSAYAASKAGLVGLAKTAARELGKFRIRVNVVAPGFVDTPMTARLGPAWRERALAESVLGRVADPEDIAACAAFLLSDAARHVTGQVLAVDGGQGM
jgi:NAD(P)-dependent dehydrogenase (short-subunit alcohol dehydrogenase family)